MLGRFALAGALLAVGLSPTYAAPVTFGWLYNACSHLGNSSQCGVQIDYHGTNNVAYTGQVLEQNGTQVAGTFQTGSDNHAYTYQNGTNQLSSTVQTGSGGWSATSSIGTGTTSSVFQSN
jgi:hypothetical protein